MSTLPSACDARDSEIDKLEVVACASECYYCENGICEDAVSMERVTFPAWRNTTTGVCWSRETVRGVLAASAHPRDPLSGRRWELPEEKWDINEVIELKVEGLDDAAVLLFERTLPLALAWRVSDIISLYEVCMSREAEKLRTCTIKFARWSVANLIALHAVGLKHAAWQTHVTTIKYVTSWSVADVIALHTAGLRREARSLFEWTLPRALWSVPEIIAMHKMGPSHTARQLFGTTLKYATVWNEDDVTLLWEAGLQEEATALTHRHKKPMSLYERLFCPMLKIPQ